MQMEKTIRERFNEQIFSEIRDRFQIPVNKISLLNGFESFIYETQKDDCDLILRVSHLNRRSENMILGEVDWIDYLVGGGVTASLAVPAPSGKYVEVVDDQHGGQFLATTFLKAPGGSERWEGSVGMIA